MENNISINFHNVVQLDIFSGSRSVIDFYEKEYQAHLDMKPSDDIPKIILRMRLSPLPGIKSNAIPTNHKGVALWRYSIDISDKEIQVDVTANFFGLYMVHHMIIHPSIRYQSATHDVLMLHGGAVSRKKRSIIITGKGGAGKTTTTSQLIASDSGIMPHSDDYIFLNRTGESFAYITRSHLYKGLLDTVPEIRDKLTKYQQLNVAFFSAIRSLSRDKIKWPTRIPQERLWPGKAFEMEADVQAVVSITRQDISRPMLDKSNDRSQFINQIVDMNFHEAEKFIELLLKQSRLTGVDLALDDWRSKEWCILHDHLKKIACYNLVLPKNIKNNSLDVKGSVIELLEGLLK